MMNPTKNLLILGGLPAVFLISCALSSMSKNSNKQVADIVEMEPVIDRTVASAKNSPKKKFPTLSYKQLKTLPAKKVYNYYRKLHALMSEMETFQAKNRNGLPVKPGKTKKSAYIQFIEDAFAGTETLPPYKEGNDCLIGGYWGTWTKKSNGRISCASPESCSPGGNVKGHFCNPKFFGYHDEATGERFCAVLSNDLTKSSCTSVVEEYKSKYGEEK